MSSRRGFVKNMAAILGTASVHTMIESALSSGIKAASIENLAMDEELRASDQIFWNWVRDSFTVSRNIINLNNGGVSPQPKITQDAQDKYNRMSNEAPSYYMWRIIDAGREPLRENLAQLAGCSPEEIAINRNSTEGLNTIIFGLNLRKGDEIVMSNFDYPNMNNAWNQRAKRDGVILKKAILPLPLDNDESIVKLYTDLFTSKTKIVHLTHIINWTGQIIPVRKIADEAHKRGIEVIVDGAHSFAHLEYKIPELGADYFGTSLHKWLCAPFGSGLMYIKKEKIKNVWALLSSDEPDGDNIRKFESLGTRSFAKEMAIGYSLDFHNMITTKRKQERLHYLKSYWATRVLDNPKVYMNTSLKPEFSCALANFGIKGMTGSEIDQKLFSKYKIHTVAIKHEHFDGVRVTPNIYTNEEDLDKLVQAINEISV
ncbi:MAG: aminotransferase class V-fold PLP-dependent enzyme [Candidatus Kapaibacterium sp.]|nr:aminotransferase class V-fold PLP-dependent enzyme [Ignavibacteriota bacterium]MCB9221069.1 aminotransferase class V-fold PLP-dependent enzyme [Ignavibacteria bacterium]